ncbi:MAG TPA: alpha/beta hydrolase [Ramlibacter sp.]|nr:alpha/beta hydrolase [Ramlibacter sp.]
MPSSPAIVPPTAFRPSRSEFVTVRGLRVHLRRWGDPEAPLLFLCHGWMDSSATFQFVVDALQQEWNVVAPDWAGFGLTDSRGGDYMPVSNVADLDALLQHFSPCAPVRLVAHSMGAQVATLYCGVRPQRVAGLVNLDGLAPVPPQDGPAELDRLRRWLDYAGQTRSPRRFDSVAAFSAELMARNPRLHPARAEFLATEFTRVRPDGRAELLADPRHYRVGGVPRFGMDVINAALARYPGPMLWILGGRSPLGRAFARAPDGPRLLADRFASARLGRQVTLAEAGHNVQHDEPERVAGLIEEFLASAPVVEGLSGV